MCLLYSTSIHFKTLSLLIITVFLAITNSSAELALDSCNYDRKAINALLHKTEYMFTHAFDSYMTYAFPYDELQPLSCKGKDTFGGLTLSLIDTLDMLIILRRWPTFVSAVKYLRNNLSFDINTTVSVFEITIRVLGGLLSAHGFLTDAADSAGFDVKFWYPTYDDSLLRLAVDLADRLMPVFDTPTKIPYGAVHLQTGVMPDESRIASTAGAGSLLLEFGTLTRYTRDPRYYNTAFNALNALHLRSAWTGLVGNHINIITGEWVATEAGVGGLIDSYYEYMLKGYILFGDERLLHMFESTYMAVQYHVYRRPWYFNSDMWSGQTTSTLQSSLAAFFPELQVLIGRLNAAVETTRAHYSVWRRYGCLPEAYDVSSSNPASHAKNYPLRPELIEGMFYLHWATNESSWIGAAANILHSLEVNTRVPCGYAAIKDVNNLELEDLMPSFMMSETLKYLFLIFAATDDAGKRHWMRSGEFVITTEAHPLRIAVEAFEDLLPGVGIGSVKGAENNRESDHVEKPQERKETSKPIEVPKAINAHRRKCPRRARWRMMLDCGYGMGGSDFPGLSTRRPDSLPQDVEMQVQKLMSTGGTSAVRVGSVFIGANSAYKVLNILKHEVFFGKIEGQELKQLLGGCKRRCGRQTPRYIVSNTSPNVCSPAYESLHQKNQETHPPWLN